MSKRLVVCSLLLVVGVVSFFAGSLARDPQKEDARLLFLAYERILTQSANTLKWVSDGNTNAIIARSSLNMSVALGGFKHLMDRLPEHGECGLDALPQYLLEAEYHLGLAADITDRRIADDIHRSFAKVRQMREERVGVNNSSNDK